MTHHPESPIRMHHVPGPGEAIKERPKPAVEPPKRYKVLLHNDDYTTMEFVVEILRDIFRKSTEEAIRIMFSVHQEGIGIAGIYTASIAETKIAQTHKRARAEGYPLRCSMEPE